MSKGNYKKALGGLLKQGRIQIHPDHISLAAPSVWGTGRKPAGGGKDPR